MKKIATGAVFAALVVASVAPAAAATSRPKTTAVDTSALASTVPVTLVGASTSSSSNPLADLNVSGTRSNVEDPRLYAGLLAYFKADLDFEGGVYQALVDAGVSSDALTKAYGKLNLATINLIAYLQSSITYS